jgi:hypothetical protein
VLEPVSKIGFWFQIAAGPSFKPQVRLRRIEDLKRGTHPAEKGGRPKDIFEMGSRKKFATVNHLPTLNGRSK